MSVVIPRSTWKPKYANGFAVIGTQEWLDASKELWLHHSVTNPPDEDATLEEDCEHVRVIEQIGQTNFGGGISYTWVIMPSGRVFEGHSIDRQGSHTYQRNNRARAICLAGNYDEDELPQSMVNAVARLLRELAALLDGGHRDVYATACPGENAYEKIGAMNTLASSGAPIEEDDDVDAQDKAYLKEIWDAVAEGVNKPKLSVIQRHTNFLGNLIIGKSEELKKAIADVVLNVDEDALASALVARGVDGANVAEVKAALAEVLSRTSLNVGK